MKKFFLLFSLFGCLSLAGNAQSSETSKIPGINSNICWINSPLDWEVTDDSFILTGGEGSRLFTDPREKVVVNTAPIALFQPDGKFLFSCKLKVGLNTIFDAGVLMLYADEDHWCKLCFEYSPQYKPMVVTVVNNGLSDDANHDTIEGDEVYFRIAGLGEGAYACHYSLDGIYWNMVRYFYMDPVYRPKIGFLSQSPRGKQCTTEFSEIRYTTDLLKDIRSGE